MVRLAVALALGVAVAAQVCLAQDNPLADAQRLTDQARQLETEKQFDQAEALLKQVVSDLESRAGPDHPVVAIAVETLAMFEGRHGKFTDATFLIEHALAIRRKSAGRDNTDTART